LNRLLRRCGAAGLLASLFLFSVAISGSTQNDTSLRGFAPLRVAAERALEQKFQSIPDPAHAEADLRHLTSEPHMAGTEASHRTAQWLLDQYRSYGFDAEIVTYSVWLPQPREITLELTAPDNKTLASPEQPFAVDPDTNDQRAVAAFNAFSPSGEVTASVVYVNYGTQEDYQALASLGVSVEGKIVLARYSRVYRGIKTKLAEEHKAAALIIYSDPEDDGYAAGDPYPSGPWRPMSGIQRGSILYTQIYPGDPLTPSAAATPDAKRLQPADAADLPHIPTMPINAQDAAVILKSLDGQHVPNGWQGALPFTYHVGPGPAQVHMKLVMSYAQRPVYDVIAKLHGTSDDEWVVLGNHHDAWVFGGADPGSGTSAMLETARSLGELARTGWKPRRTIVMCEWDAEEPGLMGSTEWVEANRAELQAKAVAYINTDVGVTGPNFAASATPSLKNLVRDAARDVQDPATPLSIYDAWRENLSRSRVPQELPHDVPSATPPGAPAAIPTPEKFPPRPADAISEPSLGALGAGSDFCPFLDFAGIPAVDLGFNGDYGVYHSLYDDFYWMKHFGDPTFTYHAALARILGTLALRLDEADILPFDYPAYASEIARAATSLVSRAGQEGDASAALKPVSEASAELSAAAARASLALREVSFAALDSAKEREINRVLASIDQAFLAPEGLAGRPWYKHTIYAPGSYAGYEAEVLPGVSESLDRNDRVALKREASSLAAALRRAAACLDDVTRLAQPSLAPGH
jgi:N-acetylated-alpha-linked acidic dipeptidase